MHIKKSFFIVITCIEMIVIGFLVMFIYSKNQKSLFHPHIDVIDYRHVIYPLKQYPHYFELTPNTTEVDRKTWLPNSQVTYTYNADGLNDRFDYSIHKKPDAFRIAALGDSFTFGSYVNTKDNWTEILEDKLNQNSIFETYPSYEVINFGVRGHDAQYEVMTYFRKVQKYFPDMIIWFLYINDFNENNEMIYQYIQTHTFDNSSNQWETASQEIYKTNKQAVENVIANQIKSVLDSYKGIVLFVILPETPKEYIENLKRWTKDRQVYIVDTMKNIYSNSGSYLPYDGHPNQIGHQMIAQSIYSYLQNSETLISHIKRQNTDSLKLSQ